MTITSDTEPKKQITHLSKVILIDHYYLLNSFIEQNSCCFSVLPASTVIVRGEVCDENALITVVGKSNYCMMCNYNNGLSSKCSIEDE